MKLLFFYLDHSPKSIEVGPLACRNQGKRPNLNIRSTQRFLDWPLYRLFIATSSSSITHKEKSIKIHWNPTDSEAPKELYKSSQHFSQWIYVGFLNKFTTTSYDYINAAELFNKTRNLGYLGFNKTVNHPNSTLFWVINTFHCSLPHLTRFISCTT